MRGDHCVTRAPTHRCGALQASTSSRPRRPAIHQSRKRLYDGSRMRRYGKTAARKKAGSWLYVKSASSRLPSLPYRSILASLCSDQRRRAQKSMQAYAHTLHLVGSVFMFLRPHLLRRFQPARHAKSARCSEPFPEYGTAGLCGASVSSEPYSAHTCGRCKVA